MDKLTTTGYKTYYSLIGYGDGIRCAWCNKKDPSNLHLIIHDKITKFKRLLGIEQAV